MLRSFGRQLKSNIALIPSPSSEQVTEDANVQETKAKNAATTLAPAFSFSSFSEKENLSSSIQSSKPKNRIPVTGKRNRAKYCEKQLLLDFGQKGHEDVTRCRLCGMVYAPKTVDEEIHRKFCSSTFTSLSSCNFQITLSKDISILKEFKEDKGIIVQVDASPACQPYWKKIVSIKEQIDRALPPKATPDCTAFPKFTTSNPSQDCDSLPMLQRSPAGTHLVSKAGESSPLSRQSTSQPMLSPSKPFLWKFGKSKAYLYITNKQSVVGFLLAEQIDGAYYLIDLNAYSCMSPKVPLKHHAALGVVQLWASSDNPTKLKATTLSSLPPNTIRQRLLRVAQDTLIYGYTVEEREIAYQYPLSSETLAFAEQFHPSPSEISCYSS